MTEIDPRILYWAKLLQVARNLLNSSGVISRCECGKKSIIHQNRTSEKAHNIYQDTIKNDPDVLMMLELNDNNDIDLAIDKLFSLYVSKVCKNCREKNKSE